MLCCVVVLRLFRMLRCDCVGVFGDCVLLCWLMLFCFGSLCYVLFVVCCCHLCVWCVFCFVLVCVCFDLYCKSIVLYCRVLRCVAC